MRGDDVRFAWFRRRVVLADLSRPRVGLSDREVGVRQRPRTGHVTVLGALGFVPDGKHPSGMPIRGDER